MRHDHEAFDENEWTADEQARFAALSSERLPPAALKQRTMRALGNRALLGRRTTISPPLIVGLLLAASVVFAVGALVGYAAANRRPSEGPTPTVAATRAVAQLDSADSANRHTRHVVWY
jgi:hypothetical protein